MTASSLTTDLKIERWPVDRPKPYDRNPRLIGRPTTGG